MIVSTITGRIDHRLLLTYAADPDVVGSLVPAPFRPELVGGRAVVGICILRLSELRPPRFPRWSGARSDNAAHRVAVEWDDDEGVHSGVFVLRRDSAHWLSVRAGGRAFPGVHGRADFCVVDDAAALAVSYRAHDGLSVDAVATPGATWRSRLFASPGEASRFYERASRGYSSARDGGLEGVELVSGAWDPEVVDVDVRSSFYDDPVRFPPGSLELDGALLLRDLPVDWRRVPAPHGSGGRASVGPWTPSRWPGRPSPSVASTPSSSTT